jgi:hypothetical protein
MAKTWVADEQKLLDARGIDPAVEWALNEGSDYLFPEEGLHWVPVLVELKAGSDLGLEQFADGERLAPKHVETWRASVRALRLHAIGADAAERLRFVSALVTRDFFALLSREPDVRSRYGEHIARVSLGLPLEAESLPPPEQPT